MSLLNPTSFDPQPPPSSRESNRVVVTDVDMTIGAMCIFMVKWAIASIPAAIIILLIGLVFGMFFGGCMAAIFHH